jgi:[ribosomal protein S5]-alanine N-acetyltransferase
MNVELRNWKMEDLDVLVKHANNPNISNNLTNKFVYPYTNVNGISFIQFANQNTPAHIQAILLDGIVVGSIGIHPQDDIMYKNAEMGYWVAEEFWNKGIIQKAIKQMIKYGFGNFEIDRIFARPFGTNIPSQKVLEKSGFVLEATFKNTIFKNGEYKDELVYAVRR